MARRRGHHHWQDRCGQRDARAWSGQGLLERAAHQRLQDAFAQAPIGDPQPVGRPAAPDRLQDRAAGDHQIGARGRVVGIDVLLMDAIAGVDFAQIDFLDPDAPDKLKAMLGGPADVVLSDMAANATGHRPTDHLKIMALVEAAAQFAAEVLKPGGSFLAKVIQGGTERALLASLKRDFATVKHVKPAASRSDSAELYVLASGFRGAR